MKLFNEWHGTLQDKYYENPGQYRLHLAILDRMAIRVFKIAMLFTVGADDLPGIDAHKQELWRLKQHKQGAGQKELSPTIEIPDSFFLEALRLIDSYFIPMTVHILQRVEDATEKDLQSKIMNALKSAPDCCMTHSALLRKSRQTSKNFREMISALIEADVIEAGQWPGKSGKDETYYQLCEASL